MLRLRAFRAVIAGVDWQYICAFWRQLVALMLEVVLRSVNDEFPGLIPMFCTQGFWLLFPTNYGRLTPCDWISAFFEVVARPFEIV